MVSSKGDILGRGEKRRFNWRFELFLADSTAAEAKQERE
jgi:hypothetical protein